MQHPTRNAGRRAICFAVLSALSAAAAGCQRRSPGPWECREHAARVLTSRGMPLAGPELEHAYHSEISRCLTTPYDRALIRCVEEQGASRLCYYDFMRRLGPEHGELPDG